MMMNNDTHKHHIHSITSHPLSLLLHHGSSSTSSSSSSSSSSPLESLESLLLTYNSNPLDHSASFIPSNINHHNTHIINTINNNINNSPHNDIIPSPHSSFDTFNYSSLLPSQYIHSQNFNIINAINSNSPFDTTSTQPVQFPFDYPMLQQIEKRRYEQSLLHKCSEDSATDYKYHLSRDNPHNPLLQECEPASKKFCSSRRKSEYINNNNNASSCIAEPRSCATNAPTMAARNRRERIRTRMKILQSLLPSAYKLDIVTMLDKAISHVKFLQLQIKVLSDDKYWITPLERKLMTSDNQMDINDSLQH